MSAPCRIRNPIPMNNRMRRLLAGLLCLLAVNLSLEAAPPRQILIVLDGFRPDYLSESDTPNLTSLAKSGVFFENHHAVFPTVTRVNASSFSTGVYPHKHGLLGNTVYFPEVDPTQGLNTASRGDLERIDKSTAGNLLTAPTLGEILEANRTSLGVFSAGSAGSCFLLNYKVSGGAVMHYSYTLPESLHAEAAEVLGPEPPEGYPNSERNARAMTALIEFGLKRLGNEVCILWLSDPDHTAHKFGMGAPTTVESIRLVDGEIGRLLAHLDAAGERESTNILIASDHGFSTHIGRVDLSTLLASGGIKQSKDSLDAVVAGSAVYIENHDPERIRAAVELLQKTKSIGAVFTRAKEPGSPLGWIDGTLSFDLIRWNHDRAADILVSSNWDEEPNEAGFRGRTHQMGVAGHGTSSPWDIHNTLIAAGPDFKSGVSNPVPSGNVDLAPTVLHLSGIEPPDSMDGRILLESLRSGPDPGSVPVTKTVHEATAAGDDWRYRLELTELEAAGSCYLNRTQVSR